MCLCLPDYLFYKTYHEKNSITFTPCSLHLSILSLILTPELFFNISLFIFYFCFSDRHYKNTPTNYTRYLARSTSARSSAPSHVHSSSAPAAMNQLLDRNGGYCTSFNTPHPAQLRRQRTGSEPIDPNTLVRTEKKKKGVSAISL